MALEIMRERASLEAEWRLRGELLEEIIDAEGDWSEGLVLRAEQVGVDLDEPRCLAVVESVEACQPRDLQLLLRVSLHRHLDDKRALVAMRGERALIAIAADKAEATETVRALLEKAAKAGMPAVAGMSTPSSNLAVALSESEAALRLAAQAGPGELVTHDFGPLRFLLDAPDKGEMVAMVVDQLGPLARYDNARASGELVSTLRAYLELGNRPAVAEHCHVHVSTVKYRMQKASDLLGRSLSDPHVRFELRLAFEVLDVLSTLGIDPLGDLDGGDEGGATEPGSGPSRMRVALLITCLTDTLAPSAGRATVQVLERLGHEVVFPEEQTCCGQMHVNSGYAEEAVPLARRLRADLRRSRLRRGRLSPSASCAAMVREQYPRLAALAGDARLAAAVDALAPRVHELSSFSSSELGVEDVGARFPHRVAYHPTCHSLRALARRRRAAAAAAARRGTRAASSCRRPTSCCGFGGTFAVKNADTSAAMLADKMRRRARHRGGGLHRGRLLLPAADRRRPLAPRQRGADDAPGRDPGEPRDDRDAASPAAARARRSPTASCARNLRKATTTIRAKRAAVVGEVPDWEELREAGRADQGRGAAPPRPPPRAARARGDRGGRHGALGPRRRRGQRDRRPADRGPPAASEVVKVKSMTTDEIGLNDALAEAGHRRPRDRPRGADRPARRRPLRRTSSCPAIHRNRAEIRDLFAAHGSGCADLSDEPAELAEAARRYLRRALPRRGVGVTRRQLRASPRPARSAWSSPRATGACARPCRETLITVMGIEKVRARASPTSRSCCSCCRARRPASG